MAEEAAAGAALAELLAADGLASEEADDDGDRIGDTSQPPPPKTKAQRFTLDPASSSTPPKFPHGFLATGL
jgi:hypothetical protein